MKKRSLISIVSMLSLLLGMLMLVHNTTFADVDYDITNVNVHAHVNKNGSLTITRSIDYDFDSDAHGVYYRQNLAKNQKLINQKVSVSTNNGKTIPIKAGNGQNNTYQLTHNNDGYRFKVFHNISEDDEVKVTYTYTITNAVINWRDTAELNFKIIGNGWDTDLDHAKVSIIFNQGKKVSDLKAWAHGDLGGHIEVNRSKGQVILIDDNVSGDVGIELHAIFPTSITPLNKNIRNEKHKQAVISQEMKLAKEANEKRKQQQLFKTILAYASLIIAVLSSGLFLFKLTLTKPFGIKPRKTSELPHNYEIPDVDPVTAQILDDGDYPDERAFTAYLTQLAGKHRLKIEKAKGHKNYHITLLDPTVKQESPFLKEIFDQAGNGESFTTKKLKKTDLEDEFDDWQKDQYHKVQDEDLISRKYEDEIEKTSTQMKVSTFFIIVTFIISLFFASQMPIIPIIIAILGGLNFIFYFIYKRHTSIYTQEGASEVEKVRGFKKMLDDIGNFKMKDVGELIFWEDVMPYAVAFGLSKQVLKELKAEFGEKALQAYFTANTYYWYYGDLNHFEKSFSSSLSKSVGDSSSYSGSSGGFSGGSSGGFGGGSGGGAF
ncbi:MAG: DUF2207 domain-containing protein [Lactobacillus sp.]|nr:DUF2207 domain-containing protein [Lactobacillus sp.]